MSIKKYALLTECVDGTYEIFHIVRLMTNNEFGVSRIARFEEAINGDKQLLGMNVSNIPNAQYNGVWDGNQFINEIEPNTAADLHEVARYALLYDNKIFFILGYDKNSLIDQKFEAAFSQNIMIKDITDFPDSVLGWIWNGSELVGPQDV